MTRAGQAGIPGERRARKIGGQFIPRLLAMIESPAYRALSLSAHRCLARIEAEHLHHGGKENGQLPVTFDHFEEYGIHRHAIAPAMRELEALGFIEITEHGIAGTAEHRAPNKFRLTYINAGRAMPTHEWRRIKTIEEALAIAKTARLPREEPRKWRIQKQKPVPVFANSQCRIPPLKATETWPAGENSPVSDSTTTSIFLGGTARDAGETLTASSSLSSLLSSCVGSKSRKKSRAKKLPRTKKREWSTPTLAEVYPGPATIDHLKALYKHQAEQAGQPDDVWIPPPSPGQRILNETPHKTLQQRTVGGLSAVSSKTS
jgi:hypothetical protein